MTSKVYRNLKSVVVLIGLFILHICCNCTFAQHWSELQKIKMTGSILPANITDFAVNDSILVIGAAGENNGNGALYFYKKTGTQFIQKSRLAGSSGSRLGTCVLLGNGFVFAGAPRYSSPNSSAGGYGKGAVYYYTINSQGSSTVNLLNSTTAGDTTGNLGISLAMVNKNLYIGANNALSKGAIYIAAWGGLNYFKPWRDIAIFPTQSQGIFSKFGSKLFTDGKNLYTLLKAGGSFNYLFRLNGPSFSASNITEITSGDIDLTSNPDMLDHSANWDNNNVYFTDNTLKKFSILGNGQIQDAKYILGNGIQNCRVFGTQGISAVSIANKGLFASYQVKEVNNDTFLNHKISNKTGIPKVYNHQVFLAQDSFVYMYQRIKNLLAYNKGSDANLHFSWFMDARCSNRQNLPVYVQLYDVNNNKEIYAEILDSLSQLNIISGNYTYKVKPLFSSTFRIRILEYGNGSLLCQSNDVVVTTENFNQLSVTVAPESYHQIAFTVNNISDHADKLTIYRDGRNYKVLDIASTMNLVDKINAEIINGKNYNYCFQLSNSVTKDTNVRICINAKTTALLFKATDKTLPNQVDLTWNTLPSNINKVKILRDGKEMVSLITPVSAYTDYKPVAGHSHLYTIQCFQNDDLVFYQQDSGSIKAKGVLSGYVLTNESNAALGVANVQIKAVCTILGKTYTYNTTTNSYGKFTINEIYFFGNSKYTVTAVKGTQKFANNNVMVEFKDKAFNNQLNFISDVVLTNEKKFNYSINNFTIVNEQANDGVKISWNVVTNDTVFYQILRNEILIESGFSKVNETINFLDITGIPAIVYNYKIKTYSLVKNKYFIQEFLLMHSYPIIEKVPINNFTIISNTALGTVDLSWNFIKPNIDGYIITRNSTVIGKVDAATNSFKDYLGDNGKTYTYGIIVFAKKLDGNFYQSNPTEKTNILFPDLPIPSITSAQSFTDSALKINFSINNTFYYHHLILTRKFNSEIDTIGYYKSGSNAMYIIDETGVHNRQYSYELRAIKNTSVGASSPVKIFKYPDFPKIISFVPVGTQKQGLASVEIKNTVITNLHQLEISVDGTKIFTGDPKLINYYINLLGKTAAVTLKTRITKTVKNITYNGVESNLNYSPAAVGAIGLDPISNFTASDNQLGQIMLKWEYPNYIIAKFYLYKDGVLFDSAMHTQRNYLLNAVTDYKPHLFQIKAVTATSQSPINSDYGNAINNQIIRGVVTNIETKNGIEGAKIIVELTTLGKTTVYSAYTNASGYFIISNPEKINTSTTYVANIQSSGGTFISPTLTGFGNNEKELIINFDASNIELFPTLYEIATIKNFTGVSNNLTNSVYLSWNLSNINYTGVEVYRGMQKLATVLHSQTKGYVDYLGAPGFDYTYRLVPYWNTNNELITGKPAILRTSFPPIYPVENVVVSPQYDEIALRWSHPTQNFDYIKIIKNGSTISTISNVDKFEFIDRNGKAGNNYAYQLSAVKIMGKDTFESIPVSIVGTFPTVTQAQNLTVSNKVPNSANVYTYKAIVSWFNASKNLDSAILFVNGKKEKTVKINEGNNSIISTSFIPGSTNTFTIVQKNFTENSKPLSVNFSNPVFSKPNFLSLTANSNTSLILASGNYNNWEYEGLDSIELLAYRNNTNLENRLVIIKSYMVLGGFFITDFARQPGLSYKYSLRIVSWRNGVRYASAETFYGSTIAIPTLAMPTNLKNVDSTGYGITLQWEHPRNDIDSFEIFDNNLPIGKVGGGIRRFTYTPAIQCVSAIVRASKKFANQTVISSNSNTLQTSIGMKILIPCNGSSAQFGRGLKMDGKKAVILAPNSNEVFCYELKPAGWVLMQKITGILYNKLALHNNMLVLANTGSSTVVILEHDGERWNSLQTISVGLNVGDVAIYDDRLVISQPTLSTGGYTNGGGFKLYRRDVAGVWNLQTTYQNPTANEFVGNTAIVINDKVIVASNQNHNSNRGKMWCYTYNSSSVSNPFYFPTGGGNNNYFASSIDLDGDTLLVGSSFGSPFGGTIGVYFYTSSPSTFNLIRNTTATNSQTLAEFGFSVAKLNGAALIGAPSFNSGTGTGGWAATSLTSNTNTYIISSGASTGYSQGTSVDAVGNWFLISSPNVGNGRVHYLERTSGVSPVPTDEITSFNASDGTFSNKVLLNWTESVINNADIDHFDILRDGQKIDQTTNTVFSYNDLDAIPGKRHIYSVIIVYATGIDKTGIHKSDIGFTQINGYIYGKVLNLQSAAALSGVMVTAEINTPEGKYSRVTNSDLKGEYNFDNLYYGESSTVKVFVKMAGSTFQKDTQEFELNPEVPKRQVPDFYETSGYSLVVNTKEFQCNCGIDSIAVNLYTYTNVGTPSLETRITDKNGKIAFSIAPKQANILKYVLKPAKYKISGIDTVYYQWNTDSLVISNPSALQKIATVNFENQITIPVDFVVGNTCGPIGNNSYGLILETENGCFYKTISTNSSGVVKNVKLPPVLFKTTVSSTFPNNSTNAIIGEYFAQRPVNSNLITIYKTKSLKAKNNSLQNVEIALTYHVFPEVSIVSGVENMCNQPDKPYVVEQGKKYNITLGLTETFNGVKCSVHDGFMVIKNTAAQEQETTLFLEKGKPIKYSFVGGEPAITYPYFKSIIIEYWNASNEFVSNTSFKVVVTGTTQIPGTDFLINNDQNELQWPLMILRDPAGDASYSYIEKEESNTLNLSVEKEIGGGFTFGLTKSSEISAFSGKLGGVFEEKFSIGGSSQYSKEFEISTTTKQKITSVQTSFTPNADNSDLLSGADADVIAGNGTAVGYGVAEQISISDNCQIFKKSLINIQPTGITTQWVYTVDFIKNLIRQYDSIITNAELGNVEIEGGSIDGFRTKKANWESILQYHKRETTPMYRLCDVNNYSRLFPVNSNQNIAVTEYMEKAKEWARNCFCGQTAVGSYTSSDSFLMQDEIVWNNELLTKYKKTRAMVERYLEAAQFVNQLNFNINDPATAKGLRAIEDGLLTYSSDAEQNLTLTNAENSMAENTSFSGGTSIDKESTIEQTYTNSFTSNFNLSNEMSFSLVQGVGISTSLGTGFIGVFFIQDGVSIDFENRLDFNYSVEFSLSKSTQKTQTSSSTSGYHLEDNDLGDQFSVTAIKGIEKNHSPYFITLGGRSTCPSEPGTIYRDALDITFEYPDGTGFNPVQRDLDPTKPAVFPLKLSNVSPTTFYEHLWYRMSPNTNTNRNGAIVSTNGNNTATYDYLLTSGQSVFTNVLVTKNSQFSSYPDLGLYLGRICTEGYDIYNGANAFFEAHFRQPCSGVSIISPAANWVIKKATYYDTTDLDETLPISLADYDLTNPLFESITLQYRRIGSNTWNNIQKFTKAQLQAYYTINRLVFKDPQYIYYWNIQGNDAIIDGDYEIRAQAFCGTGGIVYSKNIAGKISRASIELFGLPQPVDGILSVGDQISIDFNKQVLCGSITSKDFVFLNNANGDTIKMTTVCLGNKLIFNPVLPIKDLDGIKVVAKLLRMEDIFENRIAKPIIWEFEISNNPIFIIPQKINYSIYAGNKDTLKLKIKNTQNTNYSVTFSGINITQISVQNNAVISPLGLQIPISINAGNNIGVYNDTLITEITSAAGFSKIKTPIQINVYRKNPNWFVNTKQFEHTSNIICNYDMDSLGVLSEDTMDKIAVSMQGEIRGVGNIVKVGNFYRAYITVFGNISDYNKPMYCRVWNAKQGVEYEARSRDKLLFNANAFYGNTPEPSILDVKTETDTARYIPLQQGWNWISWNRSLYNNDINDYLKDLKQRKNAKIKTLQLQSNYNSVTGNWLALSNGITNINTNNGYMLYIDKADTLRISGKPASKAVYNLVPGWNLIGNTYQSNTPINFALTGNGISHLAKIKGRLTSLIQSGDYDSASKSWNGISTLIANQSYMLKNGKIATAQLRSNADSGCNWKFSEFEYNTTFFATIKINEQEVKNANYFVQAFIDGKCAGYGKVEYAPSLGRYVMNLFVYSNVTNKEISFIIFDNNTNTKYNVPETVLFNPDKSYGSPEIPYIFANTINANSIKQLASISGNITVSPNPFQHSFELKINASNKGNSIILIYDANGKKIQEINYSLSAGLNKIQVECNDKLAAGIYYVKVTQANKTEVLQLIHLD